jgi:hypothetical protein
MVMAKIKAGDRIRTIHPLSGHDLEGVVKSVQQSNTQDSDKQRIRGDFGRAVYALVSFDYGKDEPVAIELLEKISVRSITSAAKAKVGTQKIKLGAQLEPIEDEVIHPVIELGNYPIQTSSVGGFEVPSSLTHLAPSVNGSVAVSSIYPNGVGSIEAKRVKGNIYYYLRRTGSRGQQESIYLASRWPKAIDVLARYCSIAPREGVPF